MTYDIIAANERNVQQLIDDEWRKLPTILYPKLAEIEDVGVFWSHLLNFINSLGIFEFKNVSQLVLNLICIPHSNAQCERIFSKVNLIKTKQRNKLLTDTVNGSLLASQCVRNNNASCITFEPSKDMYKRCNELMYDHKKKIEFEGDRDGTETDDKLGSDFELDLNFN